MTRDRVGQWNLRLGKAVPKVKRLLRRECLDWLAVQELNGRGPELQRRLGDAYDVVVAADGDSAIIVRRGVEWGAPRSHSMGGVEWERQAGRPGLHPARIAVSLRIGPRDGGYRALSVHMPPGPDRLSLRGHARTTYLERLDHLGTLWGGRDHLGGWVMIGDWNTGRRDPRIRRLARRLAAFTVGMGVDYLMTHGVKATRPRRIGWLRAWSDHRPRTYTITR